MSHDDVTAAAELATSAGALLLEVRQRGGEPSDLKAAGDAASQAHLAAALAERFPQDAVLSEEAADVGDRLASRRVWIIDPLDGTREFSEPPRADWAVHVALWEDGRLVAAAVALPGLDLTLTTAGPFPALPPLPPLGVPRVLVSRTRPTEHALALAKGMAGELVPMGSAGAKAMAVVRGEADVYAHSGGQWEWDSAAPVAVAAAAGLHVSRIDGSPLVYNQESPWLPDLLICRLELAERALALCKGVPS